MGRSEREEAEFYHRDYSEEEGTRMAKKSGREEIPTVDNVSRRVMEQLRQTLEALADSALDDARGVVPSTSRIAGLAADLGKVAERLSWHQDTSAEAQQVMERRVDALERRLDAPEWSELQHRLDALEGHPRRVDHSMKGGVSDADEFSAPIGKDPEPKSNPFVTVAYLTRKESFERGEQSGAAIALRDAEARVRIHLAKAMRDGVVTIDGVVEALKGKS